VPAAARPAQPRALDLPGQLLSLVALGSLSFGLIETGARAWTDPLVLAALGTAAVAACAFVAVERRAREPMLPLVLFAAPGFSAANAIGVLINVGLYGQLFVINLFFQNRLGYSPVEAGLAILPEAGLLSISSILSARMTARRGPRPAMLIGLATGTVGLAALAATVGQASYVLLALPLALLGFGMAFVMPATTTAVVESAPATQAGVASGVINAARQVGSVIGIALLGSVAASGGGLAVALAIGAAAFALGLVVVVALEPVRHRATSASGSGVAFAPAQSRNF
jgi:DHA2 family methylenomycin A resistance protein-like MFS transporter